jgi:hypothetical protein
MDVTRGRKTIRRIAASVDCKLRAIEEIEQARYEWVWRERSAAVRKRAVMVAGVAAYQATMNVRTCARAFDLSEVSLCNWDDGERLITTSKFVTGRNESHDPLRDFEAANPNRFQMGIRQLTSSEFLADLRARQAQRRQAPVPVDEVDDDDDDDDEEGEELELPDDQMEELIEELNRDRVRGPSNTRGII